MTVVDISGLGIVVTAVGGTWTAANKVMDAHLDPIKKDVVEIKENIAEVKESQQQTAIAVHELRKDLHATRFTKVSQG